MPLAALLLCLLLQQPGSSKAWKQHAPRLRLAYKGKGGFPRGLHLAREGWESVLQSGSKGGSQGSREASSSCGCSISSRWALGEDAALSTDPVDAALAPLALEKGAEQGMFCPRPVQHQDQKGSLFCSDSLWASYSVLWAGRGLGTPGECPLFSGDQGH